MAGNPKYGVNKVLLNSYYLSTIQNNCLIRTLLIVNVDRVTIPKMKGKPGCKQQNNVVVDLIMLYNLTIRPMCSIVAWGAFEQMP